MNYQYVVVMNSIFLKKNYLQFSATDKKQELNVIIHYAQTFCTHKKKSLINDFLLNWKLDT